MSKSVKICLSLGVLVVSSVAAVAEDATPTVRAQRPRLFFRAEPWDGLTFAKLKTWLGTRPEYKQHYDDLKGMIGDALRYEITGDKEAAKRVLDGYTYKDRSGKDQTAPGLKTLAVPKQFGDSPSYTGIDLTAEAAAYDWLHDHPDFDAEGRRKAIAYFEAWGDYFKNYLSPGVVPFYSRNSGALTGLTAIGLALAGDSDKAAGYVAHAFKYLRENLGTIRQAEDGATGGATYGYFHEFTDIVHIVAMWGSATDWDAAAWIKDRQADWLERQMLWQIWATDPNGWLWKEGDVWSNSHRDIYEYAMNIDGVTKLYRNGYGRAFSNLMRQRWGKNIYYPSYAWKFFLNNDPTVKPKPLADLGRAEVFSPNLHAYVCWRSSWEPDATVIRFKAGENVDHHGTWDAGKFTIFKYAPLAIKSGAYEGGYLGGFHHFYKLPWSANVVVFDHPQSCGWQQRMPDLDGYTSWDAWKKRRDAVVKWPPAGRLLATEANDRYARAVADLSGATYPTGSKWVRELVFLGYKYLLVLDRVTPGADVTPRWLLQSMEPAAIDAAARTVTVTNGKGRLFCRTLLPADATFAETGLIDVTNPETGQVEQKAYSYPYWDAKEKVRKVRSFTKTWFRGRAEQQVGHGRLEVTAADPGKPTVFLHVLMPTDSGVTAMPACSAKTEGGKLTVTVGELSYTFDS